MTTRRSPRSRSATTPHNAPAQGRVSVDARARINDRLQEAEETFRARATTHEPFRVTATLTTPPSLSGPLHLDSLLAYAVMRDILGGDLDDLPDRVFPPFNIPLPLTREQDPTTGERVWRASAATLPENTQRFTAKWRKKFDGPYVDIVQERRKVDISGGAYKDRDMPLILSCTPSLTWHAHGDMNETIRLLREHIHAIGRMISSGWGQLREWHAEPVPNDQSIVNPDGTLARTTPLSVLKHLRAQPTQSTPPLQLACEPPYWHAESSRAAYPMGTPVTLQTEP